ncbi:MAG: glycosyl transferase family 2 [Candidatus Peribacteria bacterium]|nr:glycosyl transferase family 2 [Candidatus Peribacteria bacterium]
MTISVVIPAYNEEKYIGACLDSVIRFKSHRVTEIIVVDNASTDRTADIARSYPGIIVIQETRKGTGFARDAGFRMATGNILAYLDADTRVMEGWFETIEREFTKPNLVCLSGPYWFFDLPTWQSVFLYYWWMTLALPAHAMAGYTVLGGNFATRKTALEAIDGFDTKIAFYGDDTNLGRRLYAIGDVKFSTRFYTYSSARRLQGQGMIKTGILYAMNYLSEVLFHKQVTDEYVDIR